MKYLIVLILIGGCSVESESSRFVEPASLKSLYDPPSLPLPKDIKPMLVQPHWTLDQLEKDINQADPKPIASRSYGYEDGIVITFYQQPFPLQGASAWTVVRRDQKEVLEVQRFVQPYVKGF